MKVKGLVTTYIGLGLALAVAAPDAEPQAELAVFTTRAIATVLDSIAPEFERATGHRLRVTSDIAIRMVRRIRAGTPFDVLVAAPEQIDGLIADGTVIAATRADLARSGIGVAVRAGAPRPDVSSVEAFKRALLGARSVAYLKEGQSGIYLAGLMQRLGLTRAIEPRLTRPATDIVSQLVASGEVELGMVVITQILPTPGVALAGPLPAELQRYVTFTAAVSSRSAAPDAARALIAALTGSRAASVMRAQGMEPAFAAPR